MDPEHPLRRVLDDAANSTADAAAITGVAPVAAVQDAGAQ